jgi:hypothetical protein
MARVALLPIEPPEHFYAKRIAVETGFPANVVSFEIERMSRLGMVDRVEGGYREGQSTGMPPNWYVRCASQLWDVVNLAVQVVNTEFPDC